MISVMENRCELSMLDTAQYRTVGESSVLVVLKLEVAMFWLTLIPWSTENIRSNRNIQLMWLQLDQLY